MRTVSDPYVVGTITGQCAVRIVSVKYVVKTVSGQYLVGIITGACAVRTVSVKYVVGTVSAQYLVRGLGAVLRSFLGSVRD